MNSSTTTIQKFARGFICRKQKDTFTKKILKIALDNYINTLLIEKELNKHLINKKIRLTNFPSHISENIVKFCIKDKYHIYPSWDTKIGDLCILNKKIEVKGFISNGPISFGPTEKWDILYIIDGIKIFDNYFTVYEVKLSNINPIIQNIKVNKNDTYGFQCIQKRRPRITFNELYKQIGEHMTIIFKGQLIF